MKMFTLMLILPVLILQSCALSMSRLDDVHQIKVGDNRSTVKEVMGMPESFNTSSDKFRYCDDTPLEKFLWSIFTAGIIGVMTCGLVKHYFVTEYDKEDKVISLKTFDDRSRVRAIGIGLSEGFKQNPEVIIIRD